MTETDLLPHPTAGSQEENVTRIQPYDIYGWDTHIDLQYTHTYTHAIYIIHTTHIHL